METTLFDPETLSEEQKIRYVQTDTRTNEDGTSEQYPVFLEDIDPAKARAVTLEFLMKKIIKGDATTAQIARYNALKD